MPDFIEEIKKNRKDDDFWKECNESRFILLKEDMLKMNKLLSENQCPNLGHGGIMNINDYVKLLYTMMDVKVLVTQKKN